MIKRFITNKLLTALSDRPVVFISGARQVGKSTLALHLSRTSHPASYYSFDDLTVYGIVQSDPAGFIAGLNGNVIFDEVQRIPDLFYAIKAAVDKERSPGRFLLTGSANIMVLPGLSDALVGRMEIIPLAPFAVSEIRNYNLNLVDFLFSNSLYDVKPDIDLKINLNSLINTGGYPEIQTIKPERRSAWFNAYLSTIIQRDLRELSNIQGIAELPRLLRIMAAQTGQLLNFANLSRNTGIEQKTLKRYLTLLQGLDIITLLPAWFHNLGKRLIKTPKLFFNDTGILVHLLGHYISRQSDQFGHVFENFILSEIAKQASWSDVNPQLFYYRTAGGSEVDIILENSDGKIVAVEVKSTFTLKPEMTISMRILRNQLKSKFHRGIIFYFGETVIPVDRDIHAVPVGWLLPSD